MKFITVFVCALFAVSATQAATLSCRASLNDWAAERSLDLERGVVLAIVDSGLNIYVSGDQIDSAINSIRIRDTSSGVNAVTHGSVNSGNAVKKNNGMELSLSLPRGRASVECIVR